MGENILRTIAAGGLLGVTGGARRRARTRLTSGRATRTSNILGQDDPQQLRSGISLGGRGR